MSAPGIYHHNIATKFNIHQGPLYGEVICTKIKVPEALQIAKTEKRAADGTPYRFYANETYINGSSFSLILTFLSGRFWQFKSVFESPCIGDNEDVVNEDVCFFLIMTSQLMKEWRHYPWHEEDKLLFTLNPPENRREIRLMLVGD